MSEQTFIKGKERSLEESIQNLESITQEIGFNLQQGLKLHPVPHIHSLHIYEQSCPGIFTNGKGASEKACYASALGEFLERLSTNYFFSDYWLEEEVASSQGQWLYYPNEKSFSPDNFREMLSPELWAFYADLSASDDYADFAESEFEFDSFLSFNDHVEEIRALPMTAQKTGKVHYFPMNLFSNLYASNGLAAGNTALEAQVQGLSEVFERWVKNRILRENLCIPIVPAEVLNQYPAIVQAIAALQEEGIFIEVRDASLGGRFPVINVTLYHQATGLCFASFGAHPIFEVAVERTLTESLQGRHLKELDGFQMPSFDAFMVASDENIENHFIDSSGLIHANFVSHNFDYEFEAWDFSGDVAQQWQHLCELVYQQGTDVYIANYQQFGFAACRLVVPGMSEVYPKHELLDANQNFGRLLRLALLSYPQQQNPLEIVDLIDELGFSDHQGVASLIGLMPDAGSFWGSVNCLQLKFWCFLAAKDYSAALDCLLDIRHFLNPQTPWYGIYRAFEFALEGMLEEDQVFLHDSTGLQALFTQDTVNKILAHLQGEMQFWNAPQGVDIFKQSQAHQTLLGIYHNIRKYKQKQS
ncbi:hypothetical protein THMIRHAS_12880 [Thiosulfatimonas sediminis]|uniref:YcaO domain-containing protein n=1 Tax=Thiosulfatimonas sediminis TaxID=2675054 RepID=A0A6F8PUW6_9GAMM|nr:YcaO-like family protein [Thiosulfatimonas sediminis]BBP45915.1 hypothetical protein THMIRHAS_12880 [Thiosulfatimonas sediminis]